MPADPDPLEPLRKHMAKLRRSTRWFWKQCTRRRGLTEATPARLRGNFATRTGEQRERLTTALEARNYTIVNVGPRDSLEETLFETPAQTWSLAGWQAWTTEMCRVGLEVDFALFGGITEVVPEEDRSSRLDAVKAVHRATNPDLWRALVARGASEETPLALDAEFWAVNEGAALRVEARLKDELGYDVSVQAPKSGLLHRRERWSVTGTRPARPTDEAAVDAWTDRMVEIADETGTTFDGWGTWLPS